MEALLAYLAKIPADGVWRGWAYRRIGGSANNILYRATRGEMDVAVKFTIRDTRRRAWREFQALTALQDAGLNIAPRPILLDENSFAQPVMVQSWGAGEVTAVPPQADDDWLKLVAHYATLATVTPADVAVEIPQAVVNFDSVVSGWQHIQRQMELIPRQQQPAILAQLYRQLQARYEVVERAVIPVKKGLCRVDGNTRNFLRRDGRWLSVDWENSGWGDPAFEMVDLMCHPAYLDVSPQRWQRVMQQYAQMTGDETAVLRMNLTYPMMLVWWVARLARFLYEVPLGKDERLAARPPHWQADMERKMNVYVERATAVLRQL